MKENSDSDFIPNSDDEHVRIVDSRLQSKKRKALLKMKDVSTKHAGLWNHEENEIYIRFLSENREDFEDEYLRRSRKVFNRLSKLLPHRTSEQCRSHHQKLQLRSNSEKPEDIIDYVTARILKKKKTRNSLKTRPDEQNKLEEVGYVVTEGAYKEVRIILNEQFLQNW